jgi:prepilin-type N-terminal cleavage/methylation domain-containing protein/prepilin-type processing-associated H-X9-DG protein
MQYRGRNNTRDGRTPRAAFTLVELLVVIAIIGILIALLLPAVQAAREAGRRTQCGSNLHQVALALLTYEETHKIFPPGMLYDAGERPDATLKYRPNWIIMILPQMDQRPLFESFDFRYYISDPVNEFGWFGSQPGDGGRSAVIPSILCPSDNKNNRIPFAGTQSGEPGNWARGNVACNAGGAYIGNTYYHLWDAKSATWKDPKWRGVMGPNDAELSLAGITDGTTSTIFIGEVRTGIGAQDRRGTWAMGGTPSMLAMYGSNGDDNGPNFCTPAGDDVWGGSNIVYDQTELERECMAPCGTCLNYQQTVRSMHPNGANIAMADASVHFVSDFIETSAVNGDPNRTLWAVWDRLILSSDGLPVDNKRAGL